MTNPITVIAGLGNPGNKYEMTRHNAGFWFVDELARRHDGSFRHERRHDADVARVQIGGQDLWLVKPQSYMNESGGPLRSFLDYYRVPLTGIVVAHDEIDLPVATVRLKKGGGHGGHNGLRDIIACVGRDFHRLRIGVGHPGSKSEVISYVLRPASTKEQQLLDESVGKAADVVPTIVRRGIDIAMNRLNAKPKQKKPVPQNADGSKADDRNGDDTSGAP